MAMRLRDITDDLFTAASSGTMSRREVLRRAIGLGLTAPVVAQLLAACGGGGDDDSESSSEQTPGEASTATSTPGESEAAATATPASEAETEPTEMSTEEPTAGTGEATSEATAEETREATSEENGASEHARTPVLRALQTQAATILNPHLATGYKDYDASRVAYEPLADFDADGNPVLFLGVEFPTVENGGATEDGLMVTWKLRQGATWHDGQPFTASDVQFTWKYATNPDVGAVTASSFQSVESIDAPDDYTVVINFAEPNPAGFEVFTGRNGMILPEHIFSQYMGSDAHNAPANLEPVGTGPFRVTEFRPGDVAVYERNENYWDGDKPYFDRIELSGGVEAVAASRAVLQTGEADYAWGAGGDEEVVAKMEKAGIGVRTPTVGIGGDRVCINFADPNKTVDGARAEPSTSHPIFQHKEAREAVALAIPREVLANEVYGGADEVEVNNLAAPPRFASPNTSWEYNLDKARARLESAGISGGDLLYQTSVSDTRQRTQEVIKQGLEAIGFSVELKAVNPSTFFSSDPGNPDTYTHFYADLETFTYVPGSLYPIGYMERYRSDAACSKANNWATVNVTRYQNPDYDALHDQARVEMDPDRQVELFIQMNDISVNDVVEIPLVNGAGTFTASAKLAGYSPTPWTGPFYDVGSWYMKQ